MSLICEIHVIPISHHSFMLALLPKLASDLLVLLSNGTYIGSYIYLSIVLSSLKITFHCTRVNVHLILAHLYPKEEKLMGIA